MTTRRQERVAELLQEELSILISTELDDNRLEDAMLTVTDVLISQDLRNASVFIDHALPREAASQILVALRNAEQFIRRSLMRTLKLRNVPSFTFYIDRSSATGRRVDELLDQIAKEDPSEESREINT